MSTRYVLPAGRAGSLPFAAAWFLSWCWFSSRCLRGIGVVGVLLAGWASGEENWNQFRGPRGDGVSQAELPVRWSEQGPDAQQIAWKTPIHGKGWSSPVIAEGMVYLTTATEDGKQLFALGLDAQTGAIRYDRKVFDVAEPQFCHPTNSYASPTPVVENGRLYVHFGRYGTACLEAASGKRIWERRDLLCDHFRGPASSPVLFGEQLFVSYDGIDRQFVAALDKRTGATAWQRTRTIDYGTTNGDRKKAYSTALALQTDRLRQLISPSAAATIAYDPENGDELWRVRHGGMNAAARPVYANGLVYLTGGTGTRQLLAVRPDGQGDVSDTHIAWETGKSVPKRSSLLVVGQRLFMVSDQGIASCLNALTGEVLWQKRLKGGEFWASPLYAGGKIYFSSKQGTVIVVAAADTFEQLAENQLESGINASPAVLDQALFLRTFKHLYRIEAASPD